MFIIRGTKRQEKKLGYVADFCPLCHEVWAFALYRIGLAAHVIALEKIRRKTWASSGVGFS